MNLDTNLLSVMEDEGNSIDVTMGYHLVHYADPADTYDPDLWLMFDCQAESMEHAEEQCQNAYPDSVIVRVVRGRNPLAAEQRAAFYASLKVGSEVFWFDPGNGLGSELGLIQRIHAEEGEAIEDDTLIVLARHEASHVEVMAGELQ